MTIEKLIEANTAAVEENTAVQKKILAMLEEGKAGKAKTKPANDDDKSDDRAERTSRRDRDDDREPRRSRDEDEDRGSRSRSRDKDEDEDRGSRSRSRDKDEDEDRGSRSRSRDKDDDKPAKADKADKAPAKKPKKLKLADVRAAFATFMEVNAKDYDSDEDAKDEEESRRKFVESVLDELGADKTSDIKEEDFERVMGWIELKAAGKKVRFDD